MGERRGPMQHARALEQRVHEVINSVDPMGLLQGGAPEDEYAPEVRHVVGGLIRIGPNESELIPMIKAVFDKWFGFGSVPERLCVEIARGICAKWAEAVPTEHDSGDAGHG